MNATITTLMKRFQKGSIKILVYGSVIDIDQMAGCNLFCSNFYQRLRAICVGRFTCLRCFFSRSIFKGSLAFPKQNDKCPGGWGRLELTEPQHKHQNLW